MRRIILFADSVTSPFDDDKPYVPCGSVAQLAERSHGIVDVLLAGMLASTKQTCTLIKKSKKIMLIMNCAIHTASDKAVLPLEIAMPVQSTVYNNQT